MAEVLFGVLLLALILGIPAAALAFFAWLERYATTTAAMRKAAAGAAVNPGASSEGCNR
jgi:hypothetical protein